MTQRVYYGLNGIPTPRSFVDTVTPKMMALGAGAFKEVIKVK